MNDENLKQLVRQGLSAMKAGSAVAEKATSEISNDASNQDLKTALEQGNHTSKQWAERLDRAIRKVGEGDQNENPILEAHYEVSKKIRQVATEDTVRDLGIVTSGQLALHYWIASFGTMANYTRQLGLDDVSGEMKACADEAKQADQQHTGLAKRMLEQA